MSTLRLFDSTNPLQERVGKDFFEELPTAPGIYLMYGRAGQLYYVGKAKNLRRRLFTYRRASQENSSRKIRRLIRMTYDIEIECCASEKEALLRENTLIRRCKPEFNHAKKSPETYYFLTLQPQKKELKFQLGMQFPKEGIKNHTYGSFKGHRTIRKGAGALLRQLYLIEHNIHTVFDFPSLLTNNLTPLRYNLPLQRGRISEASLQQKLNSFLKGASVEFIAAIVENAHKRKLFSDYIGRLILKDCESLKYLFEHCLERNYNLKKELNLSQDLIPQEKLDDYLIQSAFLDED